VLREIVIAFVLVLVLVGSSSGQAVPRVGLGWGLDLDSAPWTDGGWHDEVSEIYTVWSEYLQSDAYRQAPTQLWSAAEQELWPGYDLTAGIAYKGMPATVLDIRPADRDAQEFVIRTLFASVSADGGTAKPVALTRVYAIREEGRWVLGGALPRLTRDWRRVDVGPVAYVIHPGMSFDVERAARAVEFARSLAINLSVPEIEEVMYVLAPSPEELHRVMGVDWTFGAQGHGYALPWNHLILSGDPEFGEDNRHELAHLLLGPILAERQCHPIVNEGLATWVGGTVGRTYEETLREYAQFLQKNPHVALDSVLEGTGVDVGWYPAGAVLVKMVHEAGGWPAVRRLISAGRSNEDLRTALAELLNSAWDGIAERWRQAVLAAF
jgi:hypothetical protein